MSIKTFYISKMFINKWKGRYYRDEVWKPIERLDIGVVQVWKCQQL